MKTYFEPKMNISVFNTENVITTSGTGTNSLTNNSNFGTTSFNAINNSTDPIVIEATRW